MTNILLFLIKIYQKYVSQILFFLGAQCRYYPSCSEYSRQAVTQHGVAHGLRLTVKRLSRCHPGCPGGIDPIPEKLS